MSQPLPILLTPGPLTTSTRTTRRMLRDWGSWDADFNQITARDPPAGAAHRARRGHARVRAAAGQRHLLGRGGHRHAGAARRPRAGAEQRRLLPAHREDLQGARPPADHDRLHRRPQVRAADVDRALAADPSITHVALVHCETGTGVLNPLHDIALVVREARPRADRRCDELLRRARDRRPQDALRRGRRRLGQVPRRRARHGLRHRQAQHAGEVRGQQPLARDGPLRPVGLHGQDDAVALHAADPRGRRAGRGASRSTSRKADSRRAAARYARNCKALDRRHGARWASAAT